MLLILSIPLLLEGQDLTENHNQVSPWWQKMRDTLGASEGISSAYIAALVGRSVAIELYNHHKVINEIEMLKNITTFKQLKKRIIKH